MKKEALSEFYLVSLPGLEDLAMSEVQRFFPTWRAEVVYGGVTVWAPFGEGLLMNEWLKIPTRILVRVARFRCKDFPKLYRTMAEFDWKQWLDPTAQLEIFVSSKSSRVKIKSRIEETCLEGWRSYQLHNRAIPSKKLKAKLYVRFVDNECTLSLDTSGDRLHKRGYRTHIGEAPLRETIASALLQLMARYGNPSKDVVLVDPMMGSGTFLLEAMIQNVRIRGRDFAEFNIKPQPEEVANPNLSTVRWTQLIGFESDEKTVKAAHENFRNLEATLSGEPGYKSVSKTFLRQDFFSAESPEISPDAEKWVIANPPYGERLEIQGPIQTYYEQLMEKMESVLAPDRVCLLLPAKPLKGKMKLPMNWKVKEKRRFLNGGLPVVAFVIGRLN
ncbi:MAG: class I SAM-dependent RNA methyltransferase [Bdellovibrionales bacterium]